MYLRYLLILLLSGFIIFPAAAKVEVSRANIRLGFSLQMHRYSWALFSCYIENTDKVRHKVGLRLFAEDSFSQTNVFSDDILALPQAGMKYSTPVMIENSENYRVDVFIDGKKQTKKETILLKLISNRTEQIAVVNSSDKISFGSFTQLKAFKKKISAVYFNSGSFPSMRALLADISAIVMLYPNYDNFSIAQYRTMINYVKEGGIIIFATPYAVIHAVDTPLVELLPVAPVRTRYIKTLPELKTLIPEFSGWQWAQNGLNFLESIPGKGTIVTLRREKFPVFCLKKYGLGEVRMSAVPLYAACWKNNRVWEKILKLFFRHQKFFRETTPVRICLDRMTGFSIPPVSVIRKFFISYFVFLAIIMALIGFIFRRPRTAWLLSAVVAISATAYILNKAAHSGKHRGNLLSFLEFNVDANGWPVPGHGYYGFFSTKNVNVTISSVRSETVFSAIPPDRTSFLPMAFMNAGVAGRRSEVNRRSSDGVAISQSFELQRSAGKPSIRDITVRSNTVRQFTSIFTPEDIQNNISAVVRPLLIYSGDGIKFKPWKVPEVYKNSEYGFLVFPSAAFMLQKKGNIFSLRSFGSEALFSTDDVINSLKSVLQYTYTNTNPCVALVEKASFPTLLDVPNTAYQGKKIHIIPAKEVISGNKIFIRPEQIILTPGDTFTRMIMAGNKIKRNIIGQGASSYSFRFTLPPVFASVKPEVISVKFVYVNQGGNILAYPALNTRSGLLNATTIKDSSYVFKGDKLRSVLNRFTGSGIITIKSKQRDMSLSQAEKLRANKWFIAELKISITGTVPEIMKNMEF